MTLKDPFWGYYRRPFWQRHGTALSKTMKNKYGPALRRFRDMKLCHPNMRGKRTNISLKPVRSFALPLHRVLGGTIGQDIYEFKYGGSDAESV